MSFSDPSEVFLILPMKQGPVFSTYSTTLHVLTEPRRSRAGQRSSCRACQSARKNGKGRVGGHLAAQARPPELHRTFGRLHLVQGTGTLLYWAAGSSKMVGEGVPYNSFAPPSHSIIWRWGLVLTTYNSPSYRAGRLKRQREGRKHTRQLSMEAWFQSFLFRPPSPPGVPSVCGQGPQ